jgi:hypothetical protein
MKKSVLVFLLLPSACMFAQKTKSNPADYPLTVRVIGSQGSGASLYQHLEAIIDGKEVELQGAARGVLALGDYQAQLKPGVQPPKKLNGHDLFQAYEFLFSDGTTRYYEVIGFGFQDQYGVNASPKNP